MDVSEGRAAGPRGGAGLALASVLQELTVAALELFDPSRSADVFLDRLVERLGGYAALLFEVRLPGRALVAGASGIGASSRALPISEATLDAIAAGASEPELPYDELSRADLVAWRFPIDVSPVGNRACLLVYFDGAARMPVQYRGMVDRLCRILSTVLMHRELFARTIASERRLDERSALLERIGDASNVGIVVFGANGELLFWNQRLLDMWGLDASIASHSRDGVVEAIAGQLREPEVLLRSVRENERNVESEVRLELHLVDERVIDVRCVPVRSRGGVHYGRGVYFVDVTERKRAEAERERLFYTERAAREAAEDAIRARDEFLSVASHELRTPLTSMQLVVQALRSAHDRGVEMPPQRALQLLENVERQTRRLARLVDELLDVSRIQAGPLQLEREDVDLVVVCQDVIARFAEERARSGSEIALHARGAVIGRWDRSRIDQVVTNVLSNALKFGRGRPVDVLVDLTDEGASALLEVKDRGMGIPPERMGRLFQRFERAVSSRHYGGLGLGLYIARYIVEMHGGRIGISSEPGVGSTVTLVLPLSDDRPDASGG
ncbi:sensor histidine kinase [Sandaracinus amylolyticus]|uniref:histidine kinase n=1 Tax=Sandaracinus amylolyticus TaxID=927083 RepID=A0A0F6YKK7_9BACT|nr:PAS domain-containing sensor histidine kinase [Sandaracinus amylolyticus]AKF08913.1 Sensory box histidine kinase [Sandaracinus amylolyticus]